MLQIESRNGWPPKHSPYSLPQAYPPAEVRTMVAIARLTLFGITWPQRPNLPFKVLMLTGLAHSALTMC
jgi:hypothetical protein